MSDINYRHFNVDGLPPEQQLLAWRDILSSVIDVVPSRELVRQPFGCIHHQYKIGEFDFSDTFTDYAVIERSIMRISRDNLRRIVFTIFLDGGTLASVTHARQRHGAPTGGGVFAVDLDQPVRLARQGCRHITFAVPPHLLQGVFADPGALHGRVLDPRKPGTQLIVNRGRTLVDTIRHMPFEDARRSLSDLT